MISRVIAECFLRDQMWRLERPLTQAEIPSLAGAEILADEIEIPYDFAIQSQLDNLGVKNLPAKKLLREVAKRREAGQCMP